MYWFICKFSLNFYHNSFRHNLKTFHFKGDYIQAICPKLDLSLQKHLNLCILIFIPHSFLSHGSLLVSQLSKTHNSHVCRCSISSPNNCCRRNSNLSKLACFRMCVYRHACTRIYRRGGRSRRKRAARLAIHFDIVFPALTHFVPRFFSTSAQSALWPTLCDSLTYFYCDRNHRF